MTSVKMNLVWSEHLSNMREEYNLFYEHNIMTDVSLFCQEHCLRAHKLVLTACSPYFKKVLQENPCKHASIIMHSVNYQDMVVLLEYIYKGHVTISQERFDNILKLAGELQIKGFEDHTNLVATSNDTDESMRNLQNIYSKRERTSIEENQNGEERNFNTLTNSTVKKETSSINLTENEILNNSEDGDDELGDHFLKQMYDEPVRTTIESFENAFDCELCNSSYKSRKDLQEHKKQHHTTCEFCHKRFSSVRDLIRHRRLHTGERPFICTICGKSFPRKDYLSLHVKSYHNMSVKSPVDSQINHNYPIIPKVEYKEETESDVEMDDHITLQNISTIRFEDTNGQNKEKRGRGRPKKDPSLKRNCDLSDVMKEKRSRGRPRKYAIVEGPKRGRGRPKKETYQPMPNTSDENSDTNIDSLPQANSPHLTREQMDPVVIIEPIVEIETEDQNLVKEIPTKEVSEKAEGNASSLDKINY